MERRHCSLYLVSPPAIPDLDGFAQQYRQVLAAACDTAAAIACVQLRLKDVSDDEIVRAAEQLIPIAHEFGAAFLINDRPDLAKQVSADGAHIGQSDMAYEAARAVLGKDASIGVTCHNSRHLAMEAGEAGADYVAFGAFYPTATKDVVYHAEAEILAYWSETTTVPSVAIGGITPENAAPLIAAGADFLAVSGSIWDHPDGAKAAIKAFADVFSAQTVHP